ncbi:hypothetical protein [Filimonas effusa]|uniref:Uncharacterized protein n=1 Tax=Filimonas effusa TaxID=2508721 RepID=A0A4Q1D8H5_9BACT|nr:hypothetical protein [Filimonas effusa]RXK85622.1 hypothetical protein ESB13_02065 [Filimonas effusa]
MTKVILEVPAEKMRSFIQLVLSLGIEKHAISSHARNSDGEARLLIKRRPFRKRFPSFLLFDWEFFSNELEYE